MMVHPPFIPEMSIIHHPFGSMNPPDIGIRERGSKIHLLECKSTTQLNGGIHFSGTKPSKYVFYFLTTTNKSIFVKGDHILSEIDYGKFEDYENRVRSLEKPHVIGVSVNNRFMYKATATLQLFGSYGDKCTEVSINELIGNIIPAPEKLHNWAPCPVMWELTQEST